MISEPTVPVFPRNPHRATPHRARHRDEDASVHAPRPAHTDRTRTDAPDDVPYRSSLF